MVQCLKCQRALPENGNCPYCGKLDVAASSPKPKPSGLWTIFKVGVALGICGLACWMLLTDSGQAFTREIKYMVGTASREAEESPWIEALRKYPRMRDVLFWKAKNQVIEEAISGDASRKRITVISRDGSTVNQWSFIVNKDTGDVRPQDEASRAMLR